MLRCVSSRWRRSSRTATPALVPTLVPHLQAHPHPHTIIHLTTAAPAVAAERTTTTKQTCTHIRTIGSGVARRCIHATRRASTGDAAEENSTEAHTDMGECPDPSASSSPPPSLPSLSARLSSLHSDFGVWSVSSSPPWRECVRALVELRRLTPSQSTSTPHTHAEGEQINITLQHFHTVLRAILEECARHSNARYPTRMTGRTLSGEMLTCCTGAAADEDGTMESSYSSSSAVRHLFRPDFRVYDRLMTRLEDSFSLAGQASSSSPTTHTSIGAVRSDENMWTLVIALEGIKTSKTNGEEDSQEESDSTMSTEPAAHTTDSGDPHRDLPSLTIVRHLFTALKESHLRPTRQTINYILAIFDAHARASISTLTDPLLFDMDDQLPGSSSASVDSTPVSSDLAFLWRIWSDLDRIYDVQPDLLTQVLMLRVCFQHRQYNYMARILSDMQIAHSLLETAQPILSHRFESPHLLLGALRHSSRVTSRIDSNERMEFLGDSVLDVLVREAIIQQLPKINNTRDPTQLHSEGLSGHILAQIKGKHVSHDRLARIARDIGLCNLLLAANKDDRSRLTGWLTDPVGDGTGRTSSGSPGVAAARSQRHIGRSAEFPGPSKRHTHAHTHTHTHTQPAPIDSSERDEATHSVSAKLAEDVFESCLAALFLDAHPEEEHNEPQSKPATATATAMMPTDPHTPDRTASSTSQPCGISAVRALIDSTMGTSIRADCHHFDRSWSSSRRLGSDDSLIDPSGFDRRLNYKRLLDLRVRAQYTDAARVCQAHVLYVPQSQFGAHTHEVRVVIKVLNGGRNEKNRNTPRIVARMAERFKTINVGRDESRLLYISFLRLQEWKRMQADAASGKVDSGDSVGDDLGTISFSIASAQVPFLSPQFDRVFPSARDRPEQSVAENRAAFMALAEMGEIRTNKKQNKNTQRGYY